MARFKPAYKKTQIQCSLLLAEGLTTEHLSAKYSGHMADGEPETGYELEGVNFWDLAWAESRKVCSREAAFSELADIVLGRRIHEILFNRKRERESWLHSCWRVWVVPKPFQEVQSFFCCHVVPCESQVPSNDPLCRWTVFVIFEASPNLTGEDGLPSWFTWWRITCWTDVFVHFCSVQVQSGAEIRDSSAQGNSCAQAKLSWFTNQASGTPEVQEPQVWNSYCTLYLMNSGLVSFR